MVWKKQMPCGHWWAKPFIKHVAVAIHTREHNAFQLPTNLLTPLIQWVSASWCVLVHIVSFTAWKGNGYWRKRSETQHPNLLTPLIQYARVYVWEWSSTHTHTHTSLSVDEARTFTVDPGHDMQTMHGWNSVCAHCINTPSCRAVTLQWTLLWMQDGKVFWGHCWKGTPHRCSNYVLRLCLCMCKIYSVTFCQHQLRESTPENIACEFPAFQ